MLRTWLVMIWIPLYLVYTIIYLVATKIIGIFSKEAAERLAKKTAKNWGKRFVGATGNKVKVIYKDKAAFETLKDEPIVVVANHQSNLDIPLILGHLGKPVGFIAKKEMESWPIIGTWMKYIHCLFLDRSDARKAVETMRAAVEQIKTGASVMIFPEGTRSETGEIGEFKKGSFKLALDSGVKILPVAIKGTYDVWKKGEKKIRKTSIITLYVDVPIDLKTLEKEEQKNIHDRVKQVVEAGYKAIV